MHIFSLILLHKFIEQILGLFLKRAHQGIVDRIIEKIRCIWSWYIIRQKIWDELL